MDRAHMLYNLQPTNDTMWDWLYQSQEATSKDRASAATVATTHNYLDQSLIATLLVPIVLSNTLTAIVYQDYCKRIAPSICISNNAAQRVPRPPSCPNHQYQLKTQKMQSAFCHCQNPVQQRPTSRRSLFTSLTNSPSSHPSNLQIWAIQVWSNRTSFKLLQPINQRKIGQIQAHIVKRMTNGRRNNKMTPKLYTWPTRECMILDAMCIMQSSTASTWSSCRSTNVLSAMRSESRSTGRPIAPKPSSTTSEQTTENWDRARRRKMNESGVFSLAEMKLNKDNPNSRSNQTKL